VADKKTDKDPKSATAKPGFDPKPVQVGGESILERLVPHMKKIVVALVGVAVVLSIYFTIRYFQDKKLQAGTEKLQKVLWAAEVPVAQPGEPVDPKANPKPYTDYKERANAVLDAMAKANTNAAGPVFRGSVLVQAGKLDDAIAELKKAQGKTGIEGVLAREGLGLAIEMKAEGEKDAAARQKGLEEALATFKSMQPDEQGPRRAFAFYHQGRILEILGKKDEAKAALEKAKDIGKGTEVVELADQRIASLGG
jgi:predicted negative regulator of RcsB-dependent stress response